MKKFKDNCPHGLDSTVIQAPLSKSIKEKLDKEKGMGRMLGCQGTDT